MKQSHRKFKLHLKDVVDDNEAFVIDLPLFALVPLGDVAFKHADLQVSKKLDCRENLVGNSDLEV